MSRLAAGVDDRRGHVAGEQPLTGLSEWRHRLRAAWTTADWRALAIRRFTCPLCDGRWLIRLARTKTGVRCLRCGASAVTLSLGAVLRALDPPAPWRDVYEMSSRGPLVEFLRRAATRLTCSEFFGDTAPGQSRDGVRCEDVEHLTFGDASFDLVTCTEVFEHVADDRAGFAEVRRVLRPGGRFIFTVPLADRAETVERARMSAGRIEHLLPPEYHTDRLRPADTVLAFREYGRDIVDRLASAGFVDAHIDRRFERAFMELGRGVLIATRAVP